MHLNLKSIMIFHKVEEVLNRNFLGLHLMVWAMLQM